MKKKPLLMLSILFILSVYGCTGIKSAGYNDYFKQKWMLTYVQGHNDATVNQSKGFIDFSVAPHENKGGAFVGCNQMFFTYTIAANNSINIKDIGSTKMMCEGIELENDFARHLEKTASYEIKGHILFLKDASGNVLIKARDRNWK